MSASPAFRVSWRRRRPKRPPTPPQDGPGGSHRGSTPARRSVKTCSRRAAQDGLAGPQYGPQSFPTRPK
eukprot:7929751-Pyramimonas_sp.AAC.1